MMRPPVWQVKVVTICFFFALACTAFAMCHAERMTCGGALNGVHTN